MSSIRSSRFYHNPQIGAAFENIASMFAPPDAGQVAAYATADARRAEAAAARAQAAREAEGWQAMTAEGVTPADQDRYGLALKFFNPSQSFRAVEMNDATLRRGQDVDSADKRYDVDATTAATRYGHDRTYQASVENNKLSELGKFFVPLNEGQNRPAVPSIVAQQYGFDGDIPQAEGRQKPLNEGEWRAARADQMWREGGFSNDQLVDIIMGQETPVKVVGPEGRPVFMTPGTAVRTGAQPYEAPTAASKPELQNWIGPNGSGGGTAIYDAASGQWQDTTTRQPLPAGSRTYTGQLQGGADATGLGPTTSNATEATRLESSLDQAQTLVGGIRSILNENKNVAGVPGRLKGVVQSLTSSAQQVAAAYAADAPEAALSIDEARNLIETKFGASMRGYDPSIVRVQSMLFDLAYARAQMANPSGEVSRQGFERALESLGQGVLSSQTDLETALDAFERDTIGAGRVKVDTLRGRRPGAAPSAGPSLASATAAPGRATRLRFDANGDPIQ